MLSACIKHVNNLKLFELLSLSEAFGFVIAKAMLLESASIEEAHASCVEVSTPVTYYKINGLLPSFLRRKIVA